MAVTAPTAHEIYEARVGPRSRSLRQNVEIELVEADPFRPATVPAGSSASSSIDRAPRAATPLDPRAAREHAARADNEHRKAALVGRSAQVRAQLAQSWSILD